MKLKAKTYTLWNLIPTLVSMAPLAMGASIVMNVMIGVIPLLSALTTAWFVDSALALLSGGKTAAELILPALSVLGVQSLSLCRWEIDSFAMGMIGVNLLKHYRPVITRKAASLEYRYIEDAKTWDLIHRMSDKPNEKLYRILDGMVYLGQLIFSVGSVLMLVAAQVWWAALVTAACFVPVVWLSLRLGKGNYEVKAQIARDERRFVTLRKMCLEREYSEERAAFGYGEYAAQQFEQEFEPAHRSWFRFQRRRFGLTGVLECLFVLVMAATACVLAFPAMQGQITVGTLVAVVREVLSMGGLFMGLNYCMTQIGEGSAYVKDLTEFANLPETEGALDAPDPEPMDFQSLEFRHVTFAYPGTQRKILDDFSLLLEKGKHYAFVGVNGAGKTTMIKLICGLYDQYEGEILLNGRELRTYTQAQLKAFCAPIFQDFARYQVPMRDSITLGAETDRLEAALDAAGLREAADGLPNGLDTPLGKIYEGGQDLSGGQWQRIAIARALVRTAPLRVLDEPTAALDPISESQFYERFGEMSRSVTTLFISHRLGSTRLADKIFVMDGGRIAEEGTQQELLSRNGLYARMFDAQRSWYTDAGRA